MANKRILKKEINYVSSELFAECVAASLYNITCDEKNIDSLLRMIVEMHSDYIMRVSHPEPGMKAKIYYGILKNSFNKEVNCIVDQIGNLH